MMISCSQCDYVVTSRSRFTQHHCAHCHLIVENRTQLNQHLKVNFTLFIACFLIKSLRQTHLHTNTSLLRDSEFHIGKFEDPAESCLKEYNVISLNNLNIDLQAIQSESSLNEDVSMESYDFMKADSVDMNKSGDESNLQHDISIDANISINSEDYENYINGEDFNKTTESTDLNLSSLSKQSVASLPPSSSDTKGSFLGNHI